MAAAKSYLPDGYHNVVVVLTHEDCNAALDWYIKALGAQQLHRSLGPDGKVMHAAFKIGDTLLMAHDAMMGGKGPKGLGGSPAALWLYVQDCDAAFKKALDAGAAQIRPVEDQFWGDRCGTLKDPHGFAWTLATHKEDLSVAEIEGRMQEFMKNMAAQGSAK